VTPNDLRSPGQSRQAQGTGQSVLKTFYLTNLSQPTELQDVVNAIRAVLDVQRVQQLLSQNALVVREHPTRSLWRRSWWRISTKLAGGDRRHRVMQVSKDKSRTLA